MMIKRVQSTLGANLYFALLNAAKIWQKQMNYRKTQLYVHIPIVLERTAESNIPHKMFSTARFLSKL